MKRMKTLLLFIFIPPLAVSFLFTYMQWYPATYAIHWLANDRGEFGLKAAILVNFLLLAIPWTTIFIIVLGIRNRIKGR